LTAESVASEGRRHAFRRPFYCCRALVLATSKQKDKDMKHLALCAAVAALGFAAPAAADPGHGHGHGWGHDRGNGYGMGGCPPGLAKKHNGCMPPGQARKLGRGDRYESGYGTLYSYQRIPYDLRRRYRLSSRYRYYDQGGTIYVVDPRTMLIEQVIGALLR
jgi:hypothetical protein